MRPNLFEFATKELSQDAFIAWLIKWASPESRSADPALAAVAERFLRRLIKLQAEDPGEITSLAVGRQWKNVDVWAEVNGKYLLVIEDKVATGEHSNQLQRYRELATGRAGARNLKLVCVYLKTGSESMHTLRRIEKQGFAAFQRRDLLDSLNDPLVKDQIFTDFREYLQAIEDGEARFASTPVAGWDDAQWRGFFRALEAERGETDWHYVPNPSGGFWNAVLNWHDVQGVGAYMQIEQGPLCFKIGDVNADRAATRIRFSEAFKSYCNGRGDICLPARFGTGAYMTIAYVDTKDWLGEDAGLVDVKQAAARLRDYEKLYSEFVHKMNTEDANPPKSPAA
jgi:hypothetical protein